MTNTAAKESAAIEPLDGQLDCFSSASQKGGLPSVQTSGLTPAANPDKPLIDFTLEDFFPGDSLWQIYVELKTAPCSADEVVRTVEKREVSFEFLKRYNSPQCRMKYRGKSIKDYYGGYTYLYQYGDDDNTRKQISSEMTRMIDEALRHIPEAREQYIARFENQIEACLENAKQSFLTLGRVFRQYRACRVYPGMKSCFDENEFLAYIENKYDFKRSSVFNMVAIVDKFCIAGGKDSAELKPMFEGYSYSQLTEMLSLPCIKSGQPVTRKDLPKLTATVAEIREYKKELQARAHELTARQRVEQNSAAVDTAQPSGQDVRLDAPAITFEPIAAPSPPAEEIEVDYSVVPDTDDDTTFDELPTEQAFEPEPEALTEKTISFNNNEQRDAFLQTYQSWPLWLDVPAIRLKVYRCKLSDNTFLYAQDCFIKDSKTGEDKSWGAYHINFYISDASGFYLRKQALSLSGVRDHFRETKVCAIVPAASAAGHTEGE